MISPGVAPREFPRRAFLGATLLGLTACGTSQAKAPDVTLWRGEAAVAHQPESEAQPTTYELSDNPIFGIDTSHHEALGADNSGVLDAAQLIRDGFSFLITKATQGTDFRDQAFPHFRRACEDAGLLFGGFGFVEAGNGALMNDVYAEYCYASGGPKGMLHCADFEWVSREPAYEDLLKYHAQHQINFPGEPLIIYTHKSFWKQKGDQEPNYHNGANGTLESPPNTELWVVDLISGGPDGAGPQGTLPEVAPQVIHPSDPGDAWRSDPIGNWNYPLIQQITFNGLPGQPVEGDIVDFNVSHFPLDRLKQIAA